MKNDTRRRSLWISDDLWDRISQAAARDQRNISSYIRSVLVKAIEAGKVATGGQVKPAVPVLLTRRQAWLIVEQMEKGADAWDDAWARNCATQVAVKIRGMIALIDGNSPKKRSRKDGKWIRAIL